MNLDDGDIGYLVIIINCNLKTLLCVIYRKQKIQKRCIFLFQNLHSWNFMKFNFNCTVTVGPNILKTLSSQITIYRVVTINRHKRVSLSHTLKKSYQLDIFILHENDIQKRIKKKKIDEATRCLGDVLDSRAVVGPRERNLLPWHVRKWGHHVSLQGVRSVLVGPDGSFAGFQTK